MTRAHIRMASILLSGAFAGASLPAAAQDNSRGGWSFLGDRTYAPTQLFIDFDLNATKLATSESASEHDWQSADLARKYLNDGLTLSNMACQTWLSQLGKDDRDVGHAKNIMNIVGSLILGIAGMNNASPASLAKGALGLTAGNALIDAYRAEILQGVVAEIEPKILEGRKTSADQALGDDGPDNYYEVRRFLVYYHALCSSNEIKRLLGSSLKEVKYSLADPTLGDAVRAAEASGLNGEVFKAIFDSNGTFDEDSLLHLYGLILGGKPVETALAGRVTKLAEAAHGKFVAETDGTKKTGVQVKLAQLDNRKGLAAKLKALLKEIEAKDAADTARAEQEKIKTTARRELVNKNMLTDQDSNNPALFRSTLQDVARSEAWAKVLDDDLKRFDATIRRADPSNRLPSNYRVQVVPIH